MSYPKTTLPLLSSPSSHFAGLISQDIAIIPSFTFESGETLTDVPVAFKTWGKLNEKGDNVMVICHALTGSADVEDWWGPLLGPSRAFDLTRYFIFCANVIGSPYGTISSVTTNPETSRVWGPELGFSCPKDDVRLHKLVLDSLGVKSVSVVIGGSMGGMTTLEYPLCTPKGYVKNIIPIATSARHSAWCISWGEAQRQSIYSDPAYDDGYYCYPDEDSTTQQEGKEKTQQQQQQQQETLADRQPVRGLAAARMAALLTYRSRDSFESRFGRKFGSANKRGGGKGGNRNGTRGGRANEAGTGTAIGGSEKSGTSTPREDAWKAHNDGHRARAPTLDRKSSIPGTRLDQTQTQTQSPTNPNGLSIPLPTLIDASSKENSTTDDIASQLVAPLTNLELSMPGGRAALQTGASRVPQTFSAQSYLRYQGDKFTSRFDANCYIHITRKMDMHDISYPTSITSDPPTLSSQLPEPSEDASESEQTSALQHALSLLPPALVIGVESDGLFTTREQREIASSIPDSELVIIPSPDGHDGFLLEFEAINGWVSVWLRKKLPEIYEGEPLVKEVDGEEGFGVKKESLFGEAEADITRW